MNNYELRVFNCAERSHFFLQKPEVGVLTAKEITFATGLATAYNGLKDYLVDQGAGSRGFREGAAERRLLVEEMKEMNRRIASIAKSVAEEGVDPGMAEKFRLPRNRTYMNVLSSALGFANAAEPQEALFTERGMEATFVDDLRGLAAAFEAASGIRVDGLTVQTTGTAGLRLLTKDALKYVRLLRPLISEKLKNNLALQAAWKMAARVARPGTVEAPATTPEPPSSGSGS